MELNDFNQAIEKIFRIKPERGNRHYQYYKFDAREILGTVEFRLKKKLFRDTCAALDKMETQDGFEIYNRRNYEVSVSEGSRSYFARRDEIRTEDTVNGLNYCLKTPSNEYLVFFIENLARLAENEEVFMPSMLHRIRRRIIHGSVQGQEKHTLELFDILKEIVPRFKTLKITSNSDRTLREFENYSSSFLFTIGYNTDLSFFPTNITEDFTRAVRIGRIRRSSINDIEPPKRKYLQDLILYYQKGISSESADLQFLSFYHILEHFFEKIYNEDLLNTVKQKLTAPSFSYKRSKDLNSLIKIIQDKLKYKNEEFQINEPEALRLVLDKFIENFNDIKDEIEAYDPELLKHYKSKEVSFSKGNRVNFDDERVSILKNLRDRIYKTRNSIVHSKDTDKTKYLPYKHDKELSKEIILMRIIAEKIIIGSSDEL